MSPSQTSPSPPIEDAMGALQSGYDRAPPPQSRRQQILWRVGRWLRSQGMSRPATLHRAEYGVIIVNGQILKIDGYGQIQNLSASRRQEVRAPHGQGGRH